MKKAAWLGCLFIVTVVMSPFSQTGVQAQSGWTVTRERIEEVEALLTPSTRWMLERGMFMTLLETKKVEWPRAYQEATDKYAGQVRLSADGRHLYNYVAGAPFPAIDVTDPLAGFKVMWNYQQNPYIIDNVGTDFITETVNSRGGVDRTYANLWRRMAWTGRLYVDPKPVVPHNPPLRHTNLLGPLLFPSEYKGTTLLTLSYLTPERADDTYSYIPQMRRVKRIGIANRGDAVWGTEFDVDSYWGFAAKLSYWTFRILAEKEILAVVHSGKYGDRSAWCAPRDGTQGVVAALPCVLWEKRKVWVVEGVPARYPRPYSYSKRIFYIDQDFFAPLIQEMYDQQGELWKSLLMCFFVSRQPYWGYPVWPLEGGAYNYEDEWPFIPNGLMIDLQNDRATTFDAPAGTQKPSEWRTEWYFNEKTHRNSPDVYTTSYLLRIAR